MNTGKTTADGLRSDWVERVEQLRTQVSEPNEFWPRYLECAAGAVDGMASVLMVPAKAVGGGQGWRLAWEWKAAGIPEHDLGLFRGQMRGLAEKWGQDRISSSVALDPKASGSCPHILSLPLLPLQGEVTAIVLILCRQSDPATIGADLERLRLLADIPGTSGLVRSLRKARSDSTRLCATMDLLLLLNAEEHFKSAAMLACNELAVRHDCTRVSLGWTRNGYIRLQAISRMEKFEKKMSVSRALESTMEEAADQNSEIVWPAPIENTLIVRDHERFAADQKSGHLCSIPISLDDEVIGVFLLEREVRPFEEEELRHLRLSADQMSRRLSDLHHASLPFPIRWGHVVMRDLKKLLGVEHTLAKLVVLLAFALMLFLVFGRIDHRVQAPFSVRGSSMMAVPAPFDGYIDEVLAEKGLEVVAGDPLLRLDTTEILLEKTELMAEQTGHFREVQQAESEGALADMQIANARLEQVQARLGIIEHRLQRAEVNSPIDGVIVEGDLKEKVGGPVSQGELLFRVARLDEVYFEVRMREADIHRVAVGAEGKIAFASRPGEPVAIRVERIEPMAQVGPEGNIFIVRCAFVDSPQDWWRPGMSGSARIFAGRRSPGYIITYRTLDFLRLRFG